MTDTRERPKRRHRSPNGPGRFVTDLELIEYLGVPEETARKVIAVLDRDMASGFPKKSKLWGDRRYLPAVEAWLDKTNGLNPQASRKSA